MPTLRPWPAKRKNIQACLSQVKRRLQESVRKIDGDGIVRFRLQGDGRLPMIVLIVGMESPGQPPAGLMTPTGFVW
ncbi:MAG: hypothetical protein A2Y77_13890 [Planctomycetes bacterium RBG_13_62_9]|nr:MAG: hypothetical protein A2Y77_13890 [Planctomycetes bacterium RBG_13_62_9]